MSGTRWQADTSWALFENHLSFLTAHRGDVHLGDDAVDVVGFADFLSCWIPLEPDAVTPETAETVWILPWSGDGWPGRLHEAGFEAAETLAYMEAPLLGEAAGATDAVPIDIVEVTSHEQALDFAAVQSAGFLDEPSPQDSWWRETFTAVAVKNYSDPDQFFYLLHVDGQPVAVTLAVRSRDTFGIYAVTTRPEHRGKGYATALLSRARHDAISNDAQRLVLQVVVGSDAERLYTSLGLTPRFHSRHYRLPGHPS